jgi:cytochrome c biogenesis protein CcmG/thiol:disulfide interchange protein DsbE
MNRKLAAWAIPAAAVPALLLLAFGLTRNPQNLPSALIGREAPGFELELMASPGARVASDEATDEIGSEDGLDQTQLVSEGGSTEPTDMLALEDLRGRVVILNFWASWCIPCRAEHPALVQTSQTYSTDDVVLLGVLYQDTEPNGIRFMQEFGGHWPSVMDSSSRTAIDYGVYGVPETFFIDADGHIANKNVGPVNWAMITQTVDSLLLERSARGLESASESEPLETVPERQDDTSE